MVRILIVDSYSRDKVGRRAWTAFHKIVTGAFDRLNVHVDVSMRSREALEEFIYEADTEFVDPMAVTKFDRLDFIFVGGQATLLPWDTGLKQVFLLLKMCFVTNKCLFTTTFATHMVAYICATGGLNIRVINGERGKGSTLREISNMKVPKHLSKHDLAFEKDSGDLFQFDMKKRIWMPFCHSGLRGRAKFQPKMARKYRVSEPVGKEAAQLRALMMPQTLFETLLTIRNRYIQHWAFRDIGVRQFIVPRYNLRDIDEKASGSAKRKYEVCADSDDGRVPEIIECGNLFGTQFECTTKYPETVQIMCNFVREKYHQMNMHAYVDQSSTFLLADRYPRPSWQDDVRAEQRSAGSQSIA